MSRISELKQKLKSKAPLIGTFIKTPSMMLAEVMAKTELNCLCFDAEHSPFDRKDIDAAAFACRNRDMPSLVRIPSAQKEHILSALDCGATGVVVPHVKTAQDAKDVVAASFYGDKGRGYAGSTRAADYTGHGIAENLDINQSQNVVIAQIEDLEAVDNLDEIFAVEGVDCFFIGVMDLTVGLGQTNAKSQVVIDVLEKIFIASQKADVCIGMFVPNIDEASYWQQKGASLFLLSSDHGFLIKGANELANNFKS